MGIIRCTNQISVPVEFFEEYLFKIDENSLRLYLLILDLETMPCECDIDSLSLHSGMDKKTLHGTLCSLSECGLIRISVNDENGAFCIFVNEHPSWPDSKSKPVKDRLLNEVEQIKGSPLTSSQMQFFIFLSDKLRFSDELILYLCNISHMRDKFSVSYMNTIALDWHEKGIDSVDKAKMYSPLSSNLVSSVLLHIGRKNQPTMAETEIVDKWKSEFGFSDDIILYACDLAVLMTEKNRLLYADKILSDWHEHGLKELSAVKDYFNNSAKEHDKKCHGGGFGAFEQNTYDFEELEKQLVEN